MCCRYAVQDGLYINTSSKNTSTNLHRNGCNMVFMRLWKVADPFVSPNGMTRNSKWL